MRKTANYDLCQWDAEDRILREDFNSDNEKIDAAIHQANRMVHLMDVVTSAAATQVSVDLSDLDLTLYDRLVLRTRLRMPGVTIDNQYGWFQINGQSPSGQYNNTVMVYGQTSYGAGASEIELVLYPDLVGCATKTFRLAKNSSLAYAGSGEYFFNATPETLRTADFLVNNGTELAEGSEIVVYGVRK